MICVCVFGKIGLCSKQKKQSKNHNHLLLNNHHHILVFIIIQELMHYFYFYSFPIYCCFFFGYNQCSINGRRSIWFISIPIFWIDFIFRMKIKFWRNQNSCLFRMFEHSWLILVNIVHHYLFFSNFFLSSFFIETFVPMEYSLFMKILVSFFWFRCCCCCCCKKMESSIV